MIDDDFDQPDGEPEEIAQKMIQANQKWIKSLTDSCNRCRQQCHKWSWVWVYVHIMIATFCVLGQFFEPCTPIAIGVILYGHTVAYFQIRNTEKTWDMLIEDNERSILRAMDRIKDWENFLKEYRGY